MSSCLRVPAEYRLIHLRRVGSTNDEAARMAGSGAPPGLVIWADEQWGGRGRLGRHWVSPPGNLHLSVLLPLDRALAQLAQLSFVAALALWDAIRAAMPETTDPMLKWPNDILLAGKKVAGILLETHASPGGCVEAVILGMGVNLRHAPLKTPYPVTSLAAHGGDIEPGRFIELLLTALSHWRQMWRRDGFAGIRSNWLARAHPVGFPLHAQTRTVALQGQFAGLDDDGALLLRGPEGIERLMAGDVSLAGERDAVGH